MQTTKIVDRLEQKQEERFYGKVFLHFDCGIVQKGTGYKKIKLESKPHDPSCNTLNMNAISYIGYFRDLQDRGYTGIVEVTFQNGLIFEVQEDLKEVDFTKI